MLPLTFGFLLAGPVSGWLSDRYGPRLFATSGLLVAAGAFIGLMLLPVDFAYWQFAVLIFLNGVGSGLFASPNTSAIMSAVPAQHRGSASGMRATFQNSGMSLSIGIFFSLMIAGLAATLPRTLTSGLRSQGVPAAVAAHVAHLPPVSTMFAALLGYNPVGQLLAPSGTLARLPRHNVAVLTGKQFFPHVISGPFHHGLIIVFTAAAVMSVLGAVISLLRGKQFYYDGPGGPDGPDGSGGSGGSGASAPRQAPAAALVPAPDQIIPNGHDRSARRADAGHSGRNPPAAEAG
jgi:MFS family permease